MVPHENPHFRTSRKFLLLVGQWPYDEGKTKHLLRAAICVLGIMMCLTEIYEVTSWNYKFEKIILTLPSFTIVLMFYEKYFVYWIKVELVKNILERIKLDWNTLRSKSEIEIMKNHIADGWLLGKVYILAAYVTLIGYICVLSIPIALDVIRPLNENRAQRLLSRSGYLTDAHGYSFYVILHMQCTAVIGITAIIASDLFYIMVVNHGCGLCGIAGYRLEHIFDDMLFISNSRKEAVFRKRIINVVEYHLKVLEYGNLIMSLYTVSYVMQFFTAVVAVASLLVNVHDWLLAGDHMLAFAFSMELLGYYFTMFMNVMPAQWIVDYSSDLFQKLCSGNWYEAPLKTQKLLLFLMQRVQKPFVPSAAGLIDMTYKIWATTVQTSFSYFMVISSVKG